MNPVWSSITCFRVEIVSCKQPIPMGNKHQLQFKLASYQGTCKILGQAWSNSTLVSYLATTHRQCTMCCRSMQPPMNSHIPLYSSSWYLPTGWGQIGLIKLHNLRGLQSGNKINSSNSSAPLPLHFCPSPSLIICVIWQVNITSLSLINDLNIA